MVALGILVAGLRHVLVSSFAPCAEVMRLPLGGLLQSKS
ncbi:hypothetical protein U91I_01594 [alpha proteobacterium U9-1i]|nr:hypothetical protein U91I_01594 [alpha proteobacterium U9-1i]